MKDSPTVGFNGHRGFVMPIRRLAADKALTRVSARKRSIPQRPSTHLRFILYSFRHVAARRDFLFNTIGYGGLKLRQLLACNRSEVGTHHRPQSPRLLAVDYSRHPGGKCARYREVLKLFTT